MHADAQKRIESKRLLGSSTCRATVTTLIYMYSLGRELSHLSYMNHSRRSESYKKKTRNFFFMSFSLSRFVVVFFFLHFSLLPCVCTKKRRSFIQSSLHLNIVTSIECLKITQPSIFNVVYYSNHIHTHARARARRGI